MPIEPDIRVDMRRENRVRQGAGIDAPVAALAARQHGVVSRQQLISIGLEPRAIDRRIEAGRLHLLHRGVYAVGHRAITHYGRWTAAVLAGGPGAVLSHRPAGALWTVLSYTGVAHVTVARWRRSQPAIRWHSSPLPPDEVGLRDGIPVTSLPRTLLDLAAVLDRHRLAKAIGEAEVQRLTDPLSLPALLERYPGRRGVAKLRAILADARIGLDIPRNDFELEFLAFIENRRLPRPELNAWLAVDERWRQVDCLWRAERLVVELDGRAVHGTVRAFERDRARDRALVAAGWRVIRITWRQLVGDPDRLAEDLRAALGGRARH